MPNQPAIVGAARLGNFRMGYEPAALAAVRRTRVRIEIAGVFANSRVRTAGFSIRDLLNDEPNTASFAVDGTAPSVGQDVRLFINSDTPRLLFNGQLQDVDLSYEGKGTQPVWRCGAIDDIARANYRRPFGTWTNISATTIAQYIIATFAPGFTSNGVQAALPAVSVNFDGSEGFDGCVRQLAKLIGGYFYFENLDLHLFQTEASDSPDDIDSTPGRLINDPPITVTIDDSQTRTRQYGRGHAEPVPCDVLAAESIIPLVDAVMFNAAGGKAIAGTISGGSQTQIVNYTGTMLSGGGSLVGSGGGPSVAPSLSLAAGAGLGTGVYKYSYTWITAAGETLPSPLGTITTDVAAPSSALVAGAATAGGSMDYGLFDYCVTYVQSGAETGGGPISNQVGTSIDTGRFTVPITGIPIGPAGTTARKIYRRFNGGGSFLLLTTINNNSSTTGTDAAANANLGAAIPSGGTAKQVSLSGIALGPAGTTQRKIYRTVVGGGGASKLQQTVANNTATTGVTDATADGSLGADAPSSDTSGLSFAGGQINAGSTSLLTTSPAPFSASGGWVQLGPQVVRYTGISGNTLTGIPASGPGSITTTVLYGSPVLPAPALTGVTGLALAMLKGTPVSIWVQRDDLTAQAARIALDAAQGRVSDGVIEGPPIVDERRGEDSLTALCDATLALYSTPLVTMTYSTHDVKTKSGKTIIINLTNPPISQTLTIQSVDITEIDQSPGVAPRFTATASTVRQSLDAMLRGLL